MGVPQKHIIGSRVTNMVQVWKKHCYPHFRNPPKYFSVQQSSVHPGKGGPVAPAIGQGGGGAVGDLGPKGSMVPRFFTGEWCLRVGRVG